MFVKSELHLKQRLLGETTDVVKYFTFVKGTSKVKGEGYVLY